jgi:starch-binding outer membrane protein, SusD/RagB family
MNMNKKVAIFCCAVILALLNGCGEWLDTLPPDGLVFDEYWQNKEDVESVLMGAYGQFANMDEQLFIYGELRADLIQADNNLPENQRQILRGDVFPENSVCDWSGFYTVINYCNNVIKYAPEVQKTDITFTEFAMHGYISEARTLRALAYFYLVRLFRDVPLVLEPSDNDDVDFFPEKTPGENILTFIKEDLKEARLKLTGDYGNTRENKGRITQAAADALLADICLWNFEYEEALTYLDNIVNSGKYFLQPSVRWFELFNPGNSLEGILEFQFNTTLGQTNVLYNRTWVQNRYVASEFALSILDPVLSKENIRGRGSVSREATGYKVWKYCGALGDQSSVRPGSVSADANFIVYRYADILLMKAEALSQLERYGEALEIINTIRARALMSTINVGSSAAEFETAILLERAKELAFEGKRWYDLLRMGRRNNFANKSKLIEILIENAPSTQKLILSTKLSDPSGWYYPIYSREIENNANLVQNPYYEN